MVIPKNKFREIRRTLADAMDFDADLINGLVISREYCPGKNELLFCYDGNEVQRFDYEHPYDGDLYNTYGIRELYETMILIEKQKLNAPPVGLSMIDVGKVYKDRMLVNDLHNRMRYADWHNPDSNNGKILNGYLNVQGIIQDLQQIADTQFGPSSANALWNLYVPENSVAKPDFLQSKINKMEMQTLGFIENQFKRAGMLEAFTPEVKQQMEKGVPEIKHKFNKEYDGDKVAATLHLNKSTKSDAYFLNKFDLELAKAGVANTVKQTFYINTRKQEDEEGGTKTKQDVRFTLKKAYNALAGRPVYNTLTSQEGNQYKAWEKIDFKNPLQNGNYAIKPYNENYGFNLEKVLEKYPIKELANTQYKDSLIDSLHRGNLQRATFVDKDGKEEKLFVSPSITTSSLNVYTLEKQRIPTETLVEKGYIGAALAEELKNRFKQNSQEQKQQAGGEAQNQKGDAAQTQADATKKQGEKKTVKDEEKPEKQARTRQKSQKQK